MYVVAGENEDVSTASKWCRKELVQDSRAELLLKASSLIAGWPRRTIRQTGKADNDEEDEKVGEISGTDSDAVISSYKYSD
jgi:hypothetical protein